MGVGGNDESENSRDDEPFGLRWKPRPDIEAPGLLHRARRVATMTAQGQELEGRFDDRLGLATKGARRAGYVGKNAWAAGRLEKQKFDDIANMRNSEKKELARQTRREEGGNREMSRPP